MAGSARRIKQDARLELANLYRYDWMLYLEKRTGPNENTSFFLTLDSTSCTFLVAVGSQYRLTCHSPPTSSLPFPPPTMSIYLTSTARRETVRRTRFFETYQRGPRYGVSQDEDDDEHHGSASSTPFGWMCRWCRPTNHVLSNFVLMAILFSTNHGCVVACLSLATARLGTIGTWQSGVLYLSYTGSALCGATYCCTRLGPRNALAMGMALYCAYVGTFWWATSQPNAAYWVAPLGAFIGGIGAGLLWTAQGTFFARAAEEHARSRSQHSTKSTASLAGIFAFVYLILELTLRSMSTILLELFPITWLTIFRIYFLLAVASTALMGLVRPPLEDEINEPEETRADALATSDWAKATSAAYLLWYSPKMQSMIGLNAIFGFAAAFLNSFVNGYVVEQALHDDHKRDNFDRTRYVGILTAWVSAVAAVMSLMFGTQSGRRRGVILLGGATSFLLVALPFLVLPRSVAEWSIPSLLVLYTLYGIGRASFESTLKATFADFFPAHREAAFANIILQNGLASAVGFLLLSGIPCRPSVEGSPSSSSPSSVRMMLTVSDMRMGVIITSPLWNGR